VTGTAARGRSARLWRITAGAVAAALIVAALLLGLLRLALVLVPGNAERAQAWIESETGLRLEFDRIDARLRWFGPEIVLGDARVLDQDGTQVVFEADEGAVGLDLLNLFRTGELVAGRVRLSNPRITLVRLADGRIRLLGQRDRPIEKSQFDLDRLPAGSVQIVGARVDYRDLKRGGGPWTLRDLDLELRRERRYVETSGSASLPSSLGGTVRFEGRLRGSLSALTELVAHIDVEVDRLELPGLAEFLPQSVAQPGSGSGRLRAVLELDRGRIALLRTDFEFGDVTLLLPRRESAPVVTVETSEPYRPPEADPLQMATLDMQFVDRPGPALPTEVRYPVLAGKLRLRREGEFWTLSASELRTGSDSDPDGLPVRLQARLRGDLRTTFALDVAVNRVALHELWPLALAFAPRSLDRWAGLDPRGELSSVGVQLVRERAGALPQFAVAAELDSVSVRPVGRWPGFSGLTASLSGTDELGTIMLRAQQPGFSMPRYFRNPLQAERLSADGGWSRQGRTWALRANHFEVEHASGRAQGSLEFLIESRRVSPELTLEARVERADLSAVAGFIPIGRLRPNTVAWLERAFVAGEVTGGELSYRGPIRKFPFPNGEGEFRATADVSGATLDYYDGFGPLAAATGQVEFHDASISARIETGRIGGLTIAGGEFSLPDYRDPVIVVDATGSGDVGEALEMLRSSPLGPRLGEQFMALRGAGPADYRLALHMATQDPDDRRYEVTTTLRSATISTPMLRAPVQQVVGELELQNDLVRSDSLRGRFLGGPFQLAIRPGARTGNVTLAADFDGQGRVAGAELPRFIGLPEQIRMSGAADWSLQGRLEREGQAGNWPVRFDVRSDLKGLEITAPRPFAKQVGLSRPTEVRAEVPRNGVMNLDIKSGSADARLEFLRSAEGLWNLRAGIARFDGQPTGAPVRPGLQLLGDWPDFDLAEWLALSPGVPSERRLQDWLGPAEVHLDEARVLGFEFRDVSARLAPLEAAWRVSVSGPMAEGTLTIPFDLEAAAPMTLEMQRLELETPDPEIQRSDPATSDTDPRKLPGLKVEVAEFVWQSRRFGRLSADIQRTPRGLRMQRLQTRSAEFSLDGSGSWLAEGDGSRTSLELSFASSDLAAAARALRYSDAVEAQRASAEARLEWAGGPSVEALGRMNGNLSLELERGQLRTVKPGAGRMLGLLSVTELPRRLALDFRDVTDEGLAFDSVRGDFQIRDGNAYTENLLLKGAVLDIGVAGRTGLATQDYDQTIVVSGNPSGALTVAGALAAGPIGAASALLISQLFKGQLQGLTRVYYRVTGPWASPTVEQISAVGQASTTGEPATERKP
jgi:uncharacterized protein (TIGR02099 family)